MTPVKKGRVTRRIKTCLGHAIEKTLSVEAISGNVVAGVASGRDLIKGTCGLRSQRSGPRKTFTLNPTKCQKARPGPLITGTPSERRGPRHTCHTSPVRMAANPFRQAESHTPRRQTGLKISEPARSLSFNRYRHTRCRRRAFRKTRS